jgi:type VI secretion system protein VasJ
VSQDSHTFDVTLVAPLAGAAAVGRDLTYEPSFQSLQTEVEKANALSGATVDWRRVHDDCVRLLREETKDLRCASWLVIATAHLEGWSSAAKALDLYKALIETHWDAMYPAVKRLRARVGLVEWLFDGLRQVLSGRDIAPGEIESARATLPALRQLEDALAAKLGDASPGAGALRNVLRDKVESAVESAGPPPAPPADATPAAVAAPAPVAATTITETSPQPPPAGASAEGVPKAPAVPAEAGAASSIEEVVRAAGPWRDGLLSLARAARSTDASSPLGYRLARLGAWLLVDAPPDVEKGRTFIRAPRAGDVRELRELVDRREWLSACDAAEAALGEHIFWLDLQRFACAALDGLGPKFAVARKVVAAETAAFLERVPSVEALCFKDGTPFADAETLAWLATERGSHGSRGGSAGGASAGEVDDPTPALLANARTGCAQGQVVESLSQALLQAGALGSARLRFQARVALARLAAERGRKEVALAVLEPLLDEVDDTLEAWEPELCAAAIGEALRASAFRGAPAGDPTSERQNLLFRRLLRLDPVLAMQLLAD